MRDLNNRMVRCTYTDNIFFTKDALRQSETVAKMYQKKNNKQEKQERPRPSPRSTRAAEHEEGPEKIDEQGDKTEINEQRLR